MSALEVPAADRLRAPTEVWLDQTLSAEARWRWSEIEDAAVQAAKSAAHGNRPDAMEGWLLVSRWARLLASSQQKVADRWVEAMNSARLGHANLPSEYHLPNTAMSAVISAEFAAMAMKSPGFSSSFFDLLTPYDYAPGALVILDRIYRADPVEFAQYDQLALAIALVYDVPPPPHWPHGQVSSDLVSRQLRDPLEVFRFWVRAEKSRKLLHPLSRLQATELKFVVDAAASFEELEWVRAHYQFGLDTLPRAYDAISYRTDRLEQKQHHWPGPSYALPVILEEGGICIDQGYFASQVGKARGVPTLLFRGVGLDGRHAWFGYLDAQKNWRMDIGRYEEQKYVAGVAFDPQTWGDVNDHELAFLAERFHRHPRYRQSQAWLQMARTYLRLGELGPALAAARKATGLEPRNVAAWEVRVLIERAADLAAAGRENTLRQAARSLQRYPDLYVRFMREAMLVLRERGQVSRADHEARMLARKFTQGRPDLAIGQAAEMLNRTMADDEPATRLRVFEAALRQFGVGAGMDAFDRLVQPFFEYTTQQGRPGDAAKVLVATRRLIAIDPDTQFDRELSALEARL